VRRVVIECYKYSLHQLVPVYQNAWSHIPEELNKSYLDFIKRVCVCNQNLFNASIPNAHTHPSGGPVTTAIPYNNRRNADWIFIKFCWTVSDPEVV